MTVPKVSSLHIAIAIVETRHCANIRSATETLIYLRRPSPTFDDMVRTHNSSDASLSNDFSAACHQNPHLTPDASIESEINFEAALIHVTKGKEIRKEI